MRDANKYSRLRDFGLALPKRRKQLETLLAAPDFSRDKVMATVITLLDATLIRVGSTRDARENRSYGLTTLRNRHVEVNGNAILFQYLDENGDRHTVSSSDVNAYLQTLTGADFTAKDSRTWAGSALALALLRELQWEPEPDAKRHVVEMVKNVAKQLGNTPAVCRKCYIHPAVLDFFWGVSWLNCPDIERVKG